VNLPYGDNQWLKRGAVAIRSDAFANSQGSKKDYVMKSFVVVCSANIGVIE
jgi:hypothetical protein